MPFCKKKPLAIFKRLVFFVFLFSNYAWAYQVKGVIYDEKNEPLPFVNINIEGTGIGTASNLDGKYSLDLPAGTFNITFRYIGFATQVKQVTVTNTSVTLDVVMKTQEVLIKSYTFSSSKEDPAYAIIRKAQKKRKFYLEQVHNYQYDSYIKGSAYLRNAPEKVLGREILLDGLDSTRSGMIYLSESVSKVYIKGDQQKEIMVSSKVAGRSQGFSWNSALEFELNFYDNLVPTPVTERDVVSPIAVDAMTYYNYKLLGEFEDHGHKVYQIQVKPKITGGPLVNGTINIQDSTWRIHSIDIFVTKDNGMDFLDTLNMKVIFFPITKDFWVKGTQQFDFIFTFALFKIKGDGHFLGSFNNYMIDPPFEKGLFNGEVLRIEEESNKKSDSYWDSIRPVPLTNDESKDYELKDSLEDVRESKSYMDSLDRKRNKFKALDLLTGYSWERSYKRIEFSISSPIRGFHFNTVEGITLTEKLSFEKFYKKQKAVTRVDATLRYGFDSKRFYATGSFYHRFNSTNRWFIRLQGGKYVSQFSRDGMPELHNSLYTVFLEINHWRLYERSFISFSTGGEVVNGLRLDLQFDASYRTKMYNANPLTKFYIDNANRSFGNNDDFDNPQAMMPAQPTWALQTSLQLAYTPGQKYMMRPKYKLNYPSKWPKFGVVATLNFVKPDSATQFTPYVLGEAFVDQEISLGILGTSEYYVSGGYFFIKPQYFTDYFHFTTTQTAFAPRDELRSFWIMPYYRFSTADYFVQAHYQHHFKGLLLGKIPGIKKLKIYEVAGFHFMYNPQARDYYEFTIGLENIVRIIRVDFVGGFIRGEAPSWGGRIKIQL